MAYTVSFFGEKEINIDTVLPLTHKVYLLLEKIVKENEEVIFLAGRNKGFDYVAANAIDRVKHWVRNDNSTFCLVLHDMEEYYKKFIDMQEDFYDEIEICEESLNCYREISFYVKNQTMIDRSDLVIFYLDPENTDCDEALAYKYAVKKKKNIVNLMQPQKQSGK